MKELGKWQFISFISRGTAMALGLIQSFVIIRVLTVGEWGTIQLAVSIGAALGIYQHLGLASASTREIAAAKDDSDIFKIFLTSTAIRYLVTLPLALGLFVLSDKIAVGLYKNAALILPLKIYAATLVFQGVQSILNSVISGTKRFKRLFIYQVVLSLINILIFIPFVYFYRINGYFWAYFIFNIVNSILLTFLAFGPLHGKLSLPSKRDFKLLFKEIFSISIAIYIVKILATNWEKIGPNILGLSNPAEVIGIFSFAVLYARKILSISDAVTDVSLPVLSEKFSQDIEEFKDTFSKNFNYVFGFIALASSLACFWAPELIKLLVGGNKYVSAYQFIPPILLAFVIYSIMDIVKSSVYVPAKQIGHMTLSYIVLIMATVLMFYASKYFFNPLTGMSYALAAGSIVGLLYVSFSIIKTLNFHFFTYKHWLILFQTTLVGWFGLVASQTPKLLLFPPLFILILWAMLLAKIFSKRDIANFLFIWKKKK